METKVQDSFEYQAEEAKQNFQSYMTALLEVNADLLHKISSAKGNKKTGIWIEISEAEILAGHVLECVSNSMASYQVLNNTNRLLNINYKAVQAVARNDIRKAIEEFKTDQISAQQFSERVDHFVGIRKPLMKAV